MAEHTQTDALIGVGTKLHPLTRLSIRAVRILKFRRDAPAQIFRRSEEQRRSAELRPCHGIASPSHTAHLSVGRLGCDFGICGNAFSSGTLRGIFPLKRPRAKVPDSRAHRHAAHIGAYFRRAAKRIIGRVIGLLIGDGGIARGCRPCRQFAT